MDECAPGGRRTGGGGRWAAAKDWLFTVTALALLAVVAVQTYRQGHLHLRWPVGEVSAAEVPVVPNPGLDGLVPLRR
ncbi:hypothetical protein [Goodfellowiella coeruleoviolacea]|uniref:Uncharacterized protein n=1 Tax=Goodfellowiella coeruleoviolacea TaxID=334858 RepID=A0AAE3KFL8_9PSEU|nr:hypothetical protein [Goodfellowiella coeruleoviolacea]MCP2165095.1 hypothetical protein [Goodfellowiella coeruleoviolacea]